MLISDFEVAKSNSQPEDDILEALSEMEKQLVDNFMRVEVRGKRGRKVPVLLTSHMRAEIEELLLHRQQVGRQKWKPQKAKLLKLKAPHTEEGQNNARRLSKEVKNLPLMKKSL
ncbi:hypothetical protein ACOMHN_057021 [Nucella lapillus]